MAVSDTLILDVKATVSLILNLVSERKFANAFVDIATVSDLTVTA